MRRTRFTDKDKENNLKNKPLTEKKGLKEKSFTVENTVDHLKTKVKSKIRPITKTNTKKNSSDQAKVDGSKLNMKASQSERKSNIKTPVKNTKKNSSDPVKGGSKLKMKTPSQSTSESSEKQPSLIVKTLPLVEVQQTEDEDPTVQWTGSWKSFYGAFQLDRLKKWGNMLSAQNRMAGHDPAKWTNSKQLKVPISLIESILEVFGGSDLKQQLDFRLTMVKIPSGEIQKASEALAKTFTDMSKGKYAVPIFGWIMCHFHTVDILALVQANPIYDWSALKGLNDNEKLSMLRSVPVVAALGTYCHKRLEQRINNKGNNKRKLGKNNNTSTSKRLKKSTDSEEGDGFLSTGMTLQDSREEEEPKNKHKKDEEDKQEKEEEEEDKQEDEAEEKDEEELEKEEEEEEEEEKEEEDEQEKEDEDEQEKEDEDEQEKEEEDKRDEQDKPEKEQKSEQEKENENEKDKTENQEELSVDTIKENDWLLECFELQPIPNANSLRNPIVLFDAENQTIEKQTNSREPENMRKSQMPNMPQQLKHSQICPPTPLEYKPHSPKLFNTCKNYPVGSKLNKLMIYGNEPLVFGCKTKDISHSCKVDIPGLTLNNNRGHGKRAYRVNQNLQDMQNCPTTPTGSPSGSPANFKMELKLQEQLRNRQKDSENKKKWSQLVVTGRNSILKINHLTKPLIMVKHVYQDENLAFLDSFKTYHEDRVSVMYIQTRIFRIRQLDFEDDFSWIHKPFLETFGWNVFFLDVCLAIPELSRLEEERRNYVIIEGLYRTAYHLLYEELLNYFEFDAQFPNWVETMGLAVPSPTPIDKYKNLPIQQTYTALFAVKSWQTNEIPDDFESLIEHPNECVTDLQHPLFVPGTVLPDWLPSCAAFLLLHIAHPLPIVRYTTFQTTLITTLRGTMISVLS